MNSGPCSTGSRGTQLPAVREHRVTFVGNPDTLERPGPRYNEGWHGSIERSSTRRTLSPVAPNAAAGAAGRSRRHGRSPRTLDAEFAEFAALARATGVEVVGEVIQRLPRVDPATLFGSGKAHEHRASGERTRCRRAARLQRFAAAPAHQSREDRPAADRRPHDADPRHLRAARALARRAAAGRAGAAALPAIEPDRRRRAISRGSAAASERAVPAKPSSRWTGARSRARVTLLGRQLETVRKQRATRRAGGGRDPFVALVGHTNVGKSSLLNRLAGTRATRSSPTSPSRRSTRRCAACTRRRDAASGSPTRSASSRAAQRAGQRVPRDARRARCGRPAAARVDAANPDWPRQRASVEAILPNSISSVRRRSSYSTSATSRRRRPGRPRCKRATGAGLERAARRSHRTPRMKFARRSLSQPARVPAACMRDADDAFVASVARLRPSVVLLSMYVPPENKKDRYDDAYATGFVVASDKLGERHSNRPARHRRRSWICA